MYDTTLFVFLFLLCAATMDSISGLWLKEWILKKIKQKKIDE